MRIRPRYFMVLFFWLVYASTSNAQQEPVVPVWNFFELSGNAGHIAYSPDGKVLAIGSARGDEKKIVLMDIKTAARVSTLIGFSGHSFAFSPDSKCIAGMTDNGFAIWDTQTGGVIKENRLPLARGSFRIAYSPNGRTIATAGWADFIFLWDTGTWRFLRAGTNHPSEEGKPRPHHQRGIVFSPNGAVLAAFFESTIELSDVNTRQVIRVFKGHAVLGFNDVAFSPDGTMLAAGSADDTIWLWNVTTGELIRTLAGHVYGVFSIAFRPDGKVLASVDNAKTLRFWNVQSGEIIYSMTVQNNSSASRLCFSPDGQQLAHMPGLATYVQVWNVSGVREGVVFADSKKDLSTSGTQSGLPNADTKDAEQFGRLLFNILKNNDRVGLQKIVFTDQDWAQLVREAEYAGFRGVAGSFTEEWWKEVRGKKREKIIRGFENHYQGYFQIGVESFRITQNQPVTITSVEYVGFEPRPALSSNLNATRYNDSYLIIKVNGTITKHVAIDDIRVFNGKWILFEF